MQENPERILAMRSQHEYRDPATGLFEHGLFLLELDREFLRSERSGEPFTVALIELENPMQEGRTLQEFGRLIESSIREVDLACRLDGNLFGILLLKTSAEVAHVAGERIRRTVEHRFQGSQHVSVGMASFPVDAPDRQGLLNRAAAALDQAKLLTDRRVFYYVRPTAQGGEDRPRVLVVDDDRRNVKLLEGYLLPQRYEVLKDYSGEEALITLSRNEVDLMLLDIMMPGSTATRYASASRRATAHDSFPSFSSPHWTTFRRRYAGSKPEQMIS